MPYEIRDLIDNAIGDKPYSMKEPFGDLMLARIRSQIAGQPDSVDDDSNDEPGDQNNTQSQEPEEGSANDEDV